MKKLLLLIAIICVFELASQIAHSQRKATPEGLPFSAARQAGQTLYVSGQIPNTPDGRVITDSVAGATRQTMQNIQRVLEQNGYSMADVVSVTVYLADMKDYDAMNAAYAEFFEGEIPARACVGGNQIAFGAPLEISCIAYKE